MKFSDFTSEQLNELKDEDTGEYIPSVMRMGQINSIDFRFHHDPDASKFFEALIETPAFKQELTKAFSEALSKAVREQPHVGGTNWFDDVTMDIKSINLNREEIESTQMD